MRTWWVMVGMLMLACVGLERPRVNGRDAGTVDIWDGGTVEIADVVPDTHDVGMVETPDIGIPVTPCPSGRGDCDGMAATVCETDLNTTVQHCGRCGGACGVGQKCVAGRCECVPGRGDCDGDRNGPNGCEVDLTSTRDHCERCGNPCPTRANSTPSCVSGSCVPVCTPGFRDCDGREDNGCEVNVMTDANHCGECPVVCPERANAMRTCSAGSCRFICPREFADCDMIAANGCEVSLNDNPAHCGRCGRRCGTGADAMRPHCFDGQCGVGCDSVRASQNCDCRDIWTNPLTCGTTCIVAIRNNCAANLACLGGVCGCPAEQMSCSGGCAALQTDVANCGACGRHCPTGASCVSGQCQCPTGQIVCGDICVDPRRDRSHCAQCNSPCGYCVPDAQNPTRIVCRCGGQDQECCWQNVCGSGLGCVDGRCLRVSP